MSRPLRAAVLVPGLASAALALLPSLAAARPAARTSAGQVNPGLYDCWANIGTYSYSGSYLFKTPGRYSFAMLEKHGRLLGTIDTGTYKVRGKNVYPTSGPMERNHLHMWTKNKKELLLVSDKGHASIPATGCFRVH